MRGGTVLYLGPLATDIAPAYDHITRDRCGDDRAGRYRDALLRHPEGAPDCPIATT